MTIKKGNKVKVLVGKDKNKEGEIIEIDRCVLPKPGLPIKKGGSKFGKFLMYFTLYSNASWIDRSLISQEPLSKVVLRHFEKRDGIFDEL